MHKKNNEKGVHENGAPKSWNKTAGYEMWKAGKSDKEIGDALGVTAATVSYYRKKYWEEPVPVEPEVEEPSQPEPVADEIPAEECGDPEASSQEDKEEADAKMMIRALEIFVQNLKGMKAVMTFQILQALWDWESVEDLERAKLGLEYLIKLEGGRA